jgi:hypothetical protein
MFTVGDGYAAYRGPATDGGGYHRHAAFQVAVAPRGEVAMVDAAATEHRAAVLVVPPMVRHRLLACARSSSNRTTCSPTGCALRGRHHRGARPA